MVTSPPGPLGPPSSPWSRPAQSGPDPCGGWPFAWGPQALSPGDDVLQTANLFVLLTKNKRTLLPLGRRCSIKRGTCDEDLSAPDFPPAAACASRLRGAWRMAR